MNYDAIIAALYLAITTMFAANLSNIYRKYREGHPRITIYSLLATVSLIVAFLGLSLYFYFKIPLLLISVQIYLICTMLYIRMKNDE